MSDVSGITLDGLEPESALLPSEISPVDEKTQSVAERIFQDPAREAIHAGAAFEQKSTNDLHMMESESNQIIETIDLLLDLSREAAAINTENPKMTDALKSVIQQLKARGVNVIGESKEINKEQLAALKASAGTHIEKLRTKIQQIFTKMQTVIQNMSSINDTVKKMVSEQSDLIRKVLERSTRH